MSANRNPVGHNHSAVSAAIRLQAVTPSDTVDLDTEARMIYVGTGGNVAVMDTEGNTVTHVGVASGSYIGPFLVKRVMATNTTASDMIGYV